MARERHQSTDLFASPGSAGKRLAPLAERMRPSRFDDFVGQDEIVGAHRPLRTAIESDRLSSIIFWGPPGSGKTTLAQLIACHTKAHFVSFSAVTGGLAELREIIKMAEHRLATGEEKTVLFVDEIHRFNKAQQDAFLPHVERGTIILIGATTENPSFEVNAALLSRCRVHVLESVSPADIVEALERALQDTERGLGGEHLQVAPEALLEIATAADGDVRRG